jgi:hypothetical protein
MQIGRLPAQTAAQASAMVTKIISYEQSPPAGDWTQKVLFVADDPDEAGDFRALSDDLADNHLLTEPLYSASLRTILRATSSSQLPALLKLGASSSITLATVPSTSGVAILMIRSSRLMTWPLFRPARSTLSCCPRRARKGTS